MVNIARCSSTLHSHLLCIAVKTPAHWKRMNLNEDIVIEGGYNAWSLLKFLTSILPVWASPGIWLGPRGHADLLSLVNDPSVYILCRCLLKLLTVFAVTVSSSNIFQMLTILSVKKCCRKSVLVLLLCSFKECPLVLE